MLVIALAWIFREKWFWIVVLALATVILAPFIVISFVLALPPIFRLVSTLLLVICWGVAAAYKDWVKSKREQEEKMEKAKSA
jgi:hypothetical protein